MALRSAPAQKDLSPAPVITTARTSASCCASSSASPTPMLTAPLTQLRASGRLIVMTRTSPRRSVSTAASVTAVPRWWRWPGRRLTHRLQAVTNSLVPHVIQHRGHDPGTGSAERVAERDRAAVGVELLLVGADVFQPGQWHRCKGLVDFEDADVF